MAQLQQRHERELAELRDHAARVEVQEEQTRDAAERLRAEFEALGEENRALRQ